ncbi:hypothetical protein, partial [Brevibacillus sp. SIMBA_040]|uniref:hypothetical protein n=1 Tax=Brevibacillus sp. SIMBA_040 TaxID=3085781 RepID=UPI00397E8C27
DIAHNVHITAAADKIIEKNSSSFKQNMEIPKHKVAKIENKAVPNFCFIIVFLNFCKDIF